MKTTEQLHEEAQENMKALRASLLHRGCFMFCALAILTALLFAMLLK